MFTPLPVFIGLRYTRAKRRNHFISFISLSSMLGIALGVTALITVMSVMNGFEKELRERILAMTSHATIAGFTGPLLDWQTLAGKSLNHPQVIGAAPYVEAQGMLTKGQVVRGVIIRGVLPAEEPKVSDLVQYITRGKLTDLVPGQYNIILGAGLAGDLGVRLGNKVTLVAPQAKVTPAGILPRLRRFTVVGIFKANASQFDNSLALIHIDDASTLFQLDGGVTGIRVRLQDMFRARVVSRELARSLGGVYWVRDWTQYHANFFRALKIEKTVMFVILTLIVAVAAFNIVSALIMVVTDKESDIAILRTLGATPASIMSVFMVQGTIIGIVGTLMGVGGGILLSLNVESVVPVIESVIGAKILDPTVYYVTDVPSDMRWPDVILTAIVAFVMCVLATLYPAWRASRTQPAEALRYE